MNHSTAFAALADNVPPTVSVPDLGVVIAYEDYLTGQQAVSLCHQLEMHWGPEVRFQYHLWRFDLLHMPCVCGEAADEAVKADLVLFSSWADTQPSADLEAWVNHWLPKKKSQDAALISLINPSDRTVRGGEFPLMTYLRQMAFLAGLTFIPHVVPAASGQLALHTPLPEQVLMVSQGTKGMRLPPLPEHQGIND